MARLSPRGIKKRFKAVAVLHGIDLDIDDKEFVVFDGPSGCGRSTLLRLIAGLDPITEGEFSLNGRRMNGVPPSRRSISPWCSNPHARYRIWTATRTWPSARG